MIRPPTCKSCKHIGISGKFLPPDEKPCLKIRDRQNDFDVMAKSRKIECVDIFRFRPPDGVLPYQQIDGCKYYEPK